MGLFSKKEACPVCGGEVKGLFLTKIGDKKILCKTCSKQVSMNKALLETATPEFIREHLEYRRKNAEKYATHHGLGGFAGDMQRVCQMIKSIIRKEPLYCAR